MERFPVRPQPFPEESLTGYIMRITFENDVPNLSDLFTVLNIYYSKNIKRRAYQWDMFPFRVADTERLLQWMALSENMLNAMTFAPVIRKLYMNHDENIDWYKNSVSSSLVKNHRRFCPQCLKERGFYNLVWQVEEIEICDIHHSKLQSHCSTCSTEQPYVGDKMGEFKCANDCGFLFDEVPDRAEDIEYINDQLRKYEDWRYLLHPETTLIPTVGDLPPEKALHVALLYVAQGGGTEFRTVLNTVLSKENVLDMRKFVAEGGHLFKMQLDRILAVIRKAGLSVQQFSELSIPTDFVKSLFEWPREILQPCQTPWCSSCGDNRNVVRVKHDQHMYFKGAKYIKHSVCTGCWVQYGERHGNWEPIGNFVELAIQVRALLEQKQTRHSIWIQLGVERRYLLRIVGYLLYHRLVSQKVWAELRPVSEQPAGLLERFKETVMGGGSSLAKAKSLHGWDESTYYYYLANPDVQRYYIFEAYKHRRFGVREAGQRRRGGKKAEVEAKVNDAIRSFIEQEIDITVKEIAASIGLADHMLRYHGLTEKIKEAIEHQRKIKSQQREAQLREVIQQYIYQKKASDEPIFVEDVGSFIGYSSGQHLRQTFPEIAEWISAEARKDVEERKERKGEAYKAEVERIIRERYASGEKITNEDVARQMGTTTIHLRRYYPDVVAYMWKLRGTLAQDFITKRN